MDKYATYKVFKNKESGELIRVLLEDSPEVLEKEASVEWEELEVDPDE